MGDKARKAAAAMKKSGSKTVKARLSKRGQNHLRQFVKQAQNLVDNIEVGTKTFPDKDVRSAARRLFGSIEDELETLKTIAEAEGDNELVEIIDDMIEDAEGTSGVDDEPHEIGPDHEELEEDGVEVEGLEVDLGGGPSDLDETRM